MSSSWTSIEAPYCGAFFSMHASQLIFGGAECGLLPRILSKTRRQREYQRQAKLALSKYFAY